MYTIKEASERLQCNRQTINNWIKRLDITVNTVNGLYRLTQEQYNMIANKVNANRTNQYTNDHTNNAKTHNDNANMHTNDERHIKHLEDEVTYLREQLSNSQRLLDQQQQLSISDKNKIDKLEQQVEQYRLLGNQDSRSSVNTQGSGDNVRTIRVKAHRYKVHRTNEDTKGQEDVGVSNGVYRAIEDTNIEDIDNTNKGINNIGSSNKWNINARNTPDNMNDSNTHTLNSNEGIDSTNNNDQSDNSYNGKIGFFKRLFGK